MCRSTELFVVHKVQGQADWSKTFVCQLLAQCNASGAVQLWWKDTQRRTVQDTWKMPHQNLHSVLLVHFLLVRMVLVVVGLILLI